MIHSKLLSTKIYAHPEFRWALEGIDIPEADRKEAIGCGAALLTGTELNKSQLAFMRSEKYAAIHHECDLISGEYYNVLARYAQSLMRIKGYIKEGDFEVCADRYYIVKPAVYSQNESIFTCKNRAGTLFYLRFDEVEKFANESILVKKESL